MNDLKVGYLCEPQIGGTYTTFTLLREPLKERGIDFRCICPFDGRAYKGGMFSKEEGVIFLPLGRGCDEDAAIIKEYLMAEGISILVVLPESYDLTPPLVSTLPRQIKCIAHLNMITAGVYRPTRWMRLYWDGIVVVSRRQKDDLIDGYGIDERMIRVFYNGVKRSNERRSIRNDSIIKIGWSGRNDHYIKNTLLLPRIAFELRKRCNDCEFTMDIVGSGPSQGKLAQLVESLDLQKHVFIHGQMPRRELLKLLPSWHVYLFPSRFEACGYSLLEAMSAGCVPVVSNIKGVFDHIVKPECGYIVTKRGAGGYADVISELISDRRKMAIMSNKTREWCGAAFNIDRMANEYADYFREIYEQALKEKPKKIFYRKKTLGDRVRERIPHCCKRIVRDIAERCGASV